MSLCHIAKQWVIETAMSGCSDLISSNSCRWDVQIDEPQQDLRTVVLKSWVDGPHPVYTLNLLVLWRYNYCSTTPRTELIRSWCNLIVIKWEFKCNIKMGNVCIIYIKILELIWYKHKNDPTALTLLKYSFFLTIKQFCNLISRPTVNETYEGILLIQ